MENRKTYKVKNRSAAMVVYSIPELNIRREFAPGEVKNCTYEELEKLTYQAGGKDLMANFLQLAEEKVTDELGIDREPEYNLSEQEIQKLILNGSLDAFLDCLDFAPSGVIDLIKTFSISLPMTDLNKCEALKEKTGFDVAKALQHVKEQEQEEAKPEQSVKSRRVKVEEGKERRVAAPKYKVVG